MTVNVGLRNIKILRRRADLRCERIELDDNHMVEMLCSSFFWRKINELNIIAYCIGRYIHDPV